MDSIVHTLMLWSVLVPGKMWFAPSQPITIDVKPAAPVTLVLTDFAGHEIKAAGPVEIKEEKPINLREIFPAVSEPGTYVLWAVPAAKTGIAEFTGTPLVIESRADKRPMAPPGALVTRVEPLRYDPTTWLPDPKLPLILGHQIVGRVEQIGDGRELPRVRSLAKGSYTSARDPAVREAASRCRDAIEARLAEKAQDSLEAERG